jgi:hypothetical protein
MELLLQGLFAWSQFAVQKGDLGKEEVNHEAKQL